MTDSTEVQDRGGFVGLMDFLKAADVRKPPSASADMVRRSLLTMASRTRSLTAAEEAYLDAPPPARRH